MSQYFISYCNLIGSVEQLDYCKQACSLSDLLGRIKQLWHCSDCSDDELLREIVLLNQMPIQTSSVVLANNWLPYRYQTKRQLINWLIPFGHAAEPFQDDYISRCRQHLINQIIQPCTSLQFVLQQAQSLAEATPAGFIFHLSRCGSTLISGCLSELDSTCVFSEPPLLTELLLDKNLSPAQQKTCLRALVNLQVSAFPQRPRMIIKWNAWDIFHWEIIREWYPQTPVIFLVRNPVEILASHQRSAGRHMARDPSLANVHPVFNRANYEQTMLAWQSGVLGALLGEMNLIRQNNTILCLDYKEVDTACMDEICHYFNVFPHPERFAQRLKFHSKSPQIIFSNDVKIKQAIFSSKDKAQIQRKLLPLYEKF